MPDLKQALRDFVATANSGKYADENILLSKFPELKGYDVNVLKDFVATSNSGKYKTEDELFSKFPEFSNPPLKKKDPTSASNLGATSSESPKPVSKYGQQLVQMPTAQPEQEAPLVLTEEERETYVAPKIKPFDIELATKSLQKINEDRANEYRKDPSVVTREEKEKAIQQANDGILTREESLRNITSNAVTTIKMAVPKMNLVAEQGLEKLFGRELANKLVGGNIYTGNTMDEERTKTLGDIGDLMSQIEFQREVGRLEVLGELLVRNKK